MNINKMHIPVNNIPLNQEGAEVFNELYLYCLKMEKDGVFRRLTFTPSRGISTAYGKLRGPMWGISMTNALIELIIRETDGYYYRFHVGYQKDKFKGISGRRAFQIYCRELKRDGVNITDHAIENGFEVKQTIPSPRIELVVASERTYYNAHHLDINSAYNSGMAEKFPFLRKTIERLHSLRHQKPEYKDVLNMTQGFMQSNMVGYRYSHISKAGYEYTLRRLDELTNKLKDAGRRILAYNTDGIWYQGEIYHDLGEGYSLGEWKNDIVNAKIRFKSKGCYEYVVNDTYHPVFRGQSSYEKIKPRDQWVWGDIFKGEHINYYFHEGEGLVYES